VRRRNYGKEGEKEERGEQTDLIFLYESLPQSTLGRGRKGRRKKGKNEPILFLFKRRKKGR